MGRETVIVNFFAGSGAGKSTQAAGLFYTLKTSGYNCELINEYAKTCTWEKNWTALNNQFLVSAKQNYKQDMLIGQVDAIITDSPILLGLLYNKESNDDIRQTFNELLIKLFRRNHNITFYIERQCAYNPCGRNQTEEEAKAIDMKVLEMLKQYDIPYITIKGNPEGLQNIADIVRKEIERAKQTSSVVP